MLKLNQLKKECKMKAYGFQAFKDYALESNSDGIEIVISTLSPAVMHEMGITRYCAPVLQRGTIFNTADEIKSANLDVQEVLVFNTEPFEFSSRIIVSRHQGTIDILKDAFPDAKIFTENVNQNDIAGKFVIGTLPPHLIQYCKAYKAVVINDFDYAKDKDLSGQELHDRLHICDAITVEIK